MTRAELIDHLETSEPSRENDARIWERVDFAAAKICYWNAATGKPVELLSLPESGLGWLAVTKNAPHYTSSLDAKVPGENIVYVEYTKKHGWHAEHDFGRKARSGPKFVYGLHPTSEATARRIAGLLAREKSDG